MVWQKQGRKCLHLLNNVLEEHKLSTNKSINFDKFGEIEINDRTDEQEYFLDNF